MKSHIRYLLFSSVLVIVCFLIVPIIFFHQESDGERGYESESKSNSSSTSLAEDDPDVPDDNRRCTDYYYPCDQSINKMNKTICIPRSSHCDKKPDCPNGEDEIGCDYLLFDLIRMYNASSNRSLTSEEKYRKNFYHNCSLYEVIKGNCSCDFSHREKADCKHQSFTQIPPIFSASITSLNLEKNKITFIDPIIINSYVNLTIISLRFNHIHRIQDHTFANLTRLTRLYLRGNYISDISLLAFNGLVSLEKLYINDNRLKYLSLSVFEQTPRLKLLDLAQNMLQINEIDQTFPILNRMDWLDLSENLMTHISSNLLRNLLNLTKVHLQINRISHIDSAAFSQNKQLIEINLSSNHLSNMQEDLFHGLQSLRSLHLDENPLIRELPVTLFHELSRLNFLNLTNVQIRNINRFHFIKNHNLTHLWFTRFKYCLFAPQVRICHPSSDGVSSLHHLLVYPILRVSIWVVALITCFGNFIVFTWRSFSRNEDAILSLFVKNLSFADLLTGIYLISIGLNDIGFQDQYLLHALDWMSSWKCSAIGFLAMISAEVSVIILTIVAFERYRSIVFNTRLLNITLARILIAAAWLTAIMIAAYPVITSSRTGEIGYYGSNGLCFPLHIDDPYASGWRYSAFVFLGINFAAVISMLFLYTKMFMILNEDRKSSLPGHVDKNKEDMVLAVRFFFIVFTDCICWLPIILIKILAFTHPHLISPTIYAWVVVLILPINSAINPIIYTIAAPTSIRYQICNRVRKMKCSKLTDCWGSRAHSSKRNSSTTSTTTGVVMLTTNAAASVIIKTPARRKNKEHEIMSKRASTGSVMSFVTMKNNGSGCNSRRNSPAAVHTTKFTKSLLTPRDQCCLIPSSDGMLVPQFQVQAESESGTGAVDSTTCTSTPTTAAAAVLPVVASNHKSGIQTAVFTLCGDQKDNLIVRQELDHMI